MKKIFLVEIIIVIIAIFIVALMSVLAFRTDKFLPKASTQSQTK